MKLSKIRVKMPEKMSRFCGIAVLKLKKSSPEILLGMGILAMGGAIVTAVKASKKQDDILADHEERLREAKCEYVFPDEYDMAANAENGDNSSLFSRKTEKQIARETRKVYAHTAAQEIKLYLPTFAFATASIVCLVSSYSIQSKRISALSVAYAGLKESFDQYQARNIKLNGRENHEMCKYGWKEVEVEEEDPETGDIVKEKKKVPAYEGLSEEEFKEMVCKPFHDNFVVFDSSCPTYKGVATLDELTLYAAESDLQRLVRVRGWAVMNDLYDYLGMERTQEGMIEGWVEGGIPPCLRIDDPVNANALRGYRNQVWLLDPNINGNVFALLEEKEQKTRALEEELRQKRLKEEGKA